jgi:hypothetical protein
MDVRQVLATHGIGAGKYRKGRKIGGTVLTPPVVPTIISNFSAYVQTSSTLGQSHDPYEDVILASWWYSNSQSAVCRANAKNMKAIQTIFVNSENAGNNPS